MLLRQVSHHWNYVVLGCPRAWAMIDIRFIERPKPWDEDEDEDEEERSRDIPRPLALWFQRSGSANLYMSLHIDGRIASLYTALVLISQNASRLKEMDIVVKSYVVLDAVLDFIWDDAPCLRRFVIQSFPIDMERLQGGGDSLPKFGKLLKTMPGLRSLTCAGGHWPDQMPKLPHLSTLFLDQALALKFAVLLDGLENFPRLEYLTIYCSTRGYMDTPSSSASSTRSSNSRLVTLQNLISLTVDSASIAFLQKLRSHVRMPRLQILHFQIILPERDSQEYISSADGLVTFVENVPTITKLCFSHSSLPDRTLLKMLEHTPHLTELCIEDSFVGQLAIEGLTVPNGSSMICPKLQKLRFHWCSRITEDMLVDLVTFPFRSITSLNIDNCESIRSEDISSIQAATEGTVDVFYTPYLGTSNYESNVETMPDDWSRDDE